MALTSIGDRVTPSIPIEITFDAQKVATGTKITTLIGHKAASGGTANPNTIHKMVAVGDPVAAKLEVDALAGTDSEIGHMAYSFVAANALAGRSVFPAFEVLMLDNGDQGVDADAIELLKHGRRDMIVSPYPASNSVVTQELVDVAILISGPDRDLQGQFGSFVTVGSIDSVTAVQAYNYNSQKLIIASMPDSVPTDVTVNATGDLAQGSPTISNASGILNLIVGMVATSQGIPANAKVVSFTNNSVTLDKNVLASATSAGITFEITGNGPSQPERILASGHAGAMMASVFPYKPLKGVAIGGLIPPVRMSDRVQIDPNGSSEALLVAGVSPLYVQPGNVVAFIKTRTTYKLLGDGVTTVTDYNAWQQLVTLNDFREELYQVCQNPPFNNNPGGTKASLAIAQALLGEFVRLALSFEDQGAFQGVKSLVKQFQVAPSTLRRGRFDFRLPVNVLPDLDVIAINVFSTTAFDFTL